MRIFVSSVQGTGKWASVRFQVIIIILAPFLDCLVSSYWPQTRLARRSCGLQYPTISVSPSVPKGSTIRRTAYTIRQVHSSEILSERKVLKCHFLAGNVFTSKYVQSSLFDSF